MNDSRKENNLKKVLWIVRILSSQIALGIIVFVFVCGLLGKCNINIPWLAMTTLNVIVYGVFVVFVIISWFFVRLGGIIITGWGIGLIIFFITGKMWLMLFIFGIPCLICGILFLLCWNIVGISMPEINKDIKNDPVK